MFWNIVGEQIHLTFSRSGASNGVISGLCGRSCWHWTTKASVLVCPQSSSSYCNSCACIKYQISSHSTRGLLIWSDYLPAHLVACFLMKAAAAFLTIQALMTVFKRFQHLLRYFSGILIIYAQFKPAPFTEARMPSGFEPQIVPLAQPCEFFIHSSPDSIITMEENLSRKSGSIKR